MILKKQPKPQVKSTFKNPLEALGNLTGSAAQTFSKDVAKAGVDDLWKQILGKYENNQQSQTSGDLKEGQELDLSSLSHNKKQESLQKPDSAPGIDYHRDIVHGSETLSRKENQEMSVQIQQIIVELKRLAATSQELEIQFRDVIVEQRITKPGKYHQSFFEWMLIILKTARMRVEDAGAWLSLMKNKKGKKQTQNYWSMAKKHGTSFSLNNERGVATQTG
jgi:hypothetical protein